MPWTDHAYNVILVGMMLWGLGSVLYTIPKVHSWWKPIYWMALPLAILPVFIVFGTYFQFVEGRFLLNLLKFALFILSIQLVAVPWVHRLERRYLDKEDGDGE